MPNEYSTPTLVAVALAALTACTSESSNPSGEVGDSSASGGGGALGSAGASGAGGVGAASGTGGLGPDAGADASTGGTGTGGAAQGGSGSGGNAGAGFGGAGTGGAGGSAAAAGGGGLGGAGGSAAMGGGAGMGGAAGVAGAAGAAGACTPNPCATGATCVATANDAFDCQCAKDSTGELCECLAAMPVTIDWQTRPAGDFASITSDDVTVTSSNVLRVSTEGLGIVGGVSDEHIDGTEMLSVTFAHGARSVTYSSASITNGNGDGTTGEFVVEGFDTQGGSLGTFTANTFPIPVPLPVSLNTRLGADVIGGFTVTAVSDGHIHSRLTYEPAGTTVTEVDFREMATANLAQIVSSGVTVTGSSTIHVLSSNGIGIVGGTSDIFVDTTEHVTFTFDEPRYNISYSVLASTGGEGMVEAFEAGGASLGTEAAGNLGRVVVSRLFDDLPIRSFRVTAPTNGGFRIGTLYFSGCATP